MEIKETDAFLDSIARNIRHGCKFLNCDLYRKLTMIPNGKLYKYRECNNNNFESLEKQSIWLTSVSNFNDKFDSGIVLDFDDISQREKNILVSTYNLAEYSQAYLNNEVTTDPKIIADFVYKCYDKDFNLNEKKLIRLCKKGYGDYSYDDLYNILISVDRIFTRYGHGDKLREKIIEQLKDYASIFNNNMKQTIGASCFTESFDNRGLWEHYAEKNSGYCIEYSFDNIQVQEINDSITFESLLFLLPMKYIEIPIKLKGYYFDFDESKRMYLEAIKQEYDKTDYLYYDKVIKILFNKNKQYSWEKEWRIVMKDIANQLVFFPFATKIILGENISNENKNILLDISNKLNISVYQQVSDTINSKYRYFLIF